MMIKFLRFNIYLWLGAALLLLAGGCQSAKDKQKNLTVLEFHLEIPRDGAEFTKTIQIYREHPMNLTVERESFLDGVDIEEARIVEDLGGFKIQLKFNWRGTQILSGVTAANRGRRIAVMCAFPSVRWLAAPVIRNSINDGIYSFTPDCSREEAERIIKGLKDVTAEIKKSESF